MPERLPGPLPPPASRRLGTRGEVRAWQRFENVGLRGDLSMHDFKLRWPGKGVRGLDITNAVTAATYDCTVEPVNTFTITVRDPLQGSSSIFSSGPWKRDRRFIKPPRPKKVNHQKGKQRKAFQRNPTAVDEGWEPILGPELIGQGAQLIVDGITYRLVAAKPTWSTGEVELTFEHAIIYWLKRKNATHKKARRFNRKHVTRAEAILALLREVRAVSYRFVCPRLHDKQAIADGDPKTRSPRTTKRSRGSDDQHGFPKNINLPLQDAAGGRRTAQGINRRVGAAVLSKADELTDEHKPRLALMEAVMVESMVSNPSGGEGSSVGVLQLTSAHLGGSTSKNGGRMDVGLCTELFLTKGFAAAGEGVGAIGLAKRHPTWSAGQIAQACQGSAYGDKYGKVKDAAQEWLDAWSGDPTQGGTKTITKAYMLGRNEDENSWDAIQRMASDVAWRFFIVGNSVYYMSERDLYARRPRYVVHPEDDTLIEATFDIDWGKPVSTGELTISNTDRWGTPAGCVVLLDGFGPPDGRWMVSGISRDWFAPTATITLVQPGRAKKEPANEQEQRSINASSGKDVFKASKLGAKAIVEAAFAIASKFSPNIYVGSSYRPGSRVDTGQLDDHSQNNATRAARDIGYKGVDLLVGPPRPELDKAVVAIGDAFGRNYKSGKSGPFQDADTFHWHGFRIQIIWRTPRWGGHMGHIHVGARKE